MKKRQQLSQNDSSLCATIPQKVVEAFDISTKRFFQWSTKGSEITGTYCQSETVVTTRIQAAKNNRFQIEVLPVYVKRHHLVPTKKGGPTADFEWDGDSVRIRIRMKDERKQTPSPKDSPENPEKVSTVRKVLGKLFRTPPSE